ncbi:MAG: hypothetical protein HYZ84_05395 [Candidatus Omnitrophica bacterium]|nr:hypothetical protein [Candidatus Omnitrophota bacterium]
MRQPESHESAGSYWGALLKDKRISTALVRFAIRPVDDKGEYRLEVDPATQSAVSHGIAASNSELRTTQRLVSSVVIELLKSLEKLSNPKVSSLAIFPSNPDQTNPTGLITLFDDTEIIEEREIPTSLALGLLAKRAGIFIYFDQESHRKPGPLGHIILRILKADMSKRSIADFLQPRLQPFGVTKVTIDDKEVLPGFKNIHIHIGPLPIPGLGPQAVPPASAVEAESEMRSVTAKAALLSPQAALVADTFTARILRSPLMQLGRTIFTALVLSLIPPAMAAVEASPMIPDSAAAILGVKNAASSDGWILSEFAVKEYVLPVILDTAGVSHKPVAVVTQRPELRKIVAAYSELRVSKGGSPLFAAPDVRSAHRWLRRELQSQSETRSSISIGAMFYPADLDFSEILRLKQIVRDVAIVTDQMVNRLARDFDNLVTAFKGWAALLRSA